MSREIYRIAWTGPARRTLRRVPEKVAAAAVELIYGSLASDPHRMGKPLRFEGLHSARRGDYRVIFRIDDAWRVVELLAIELRADVYRRR